MSQEEPGGARSPHAGMPPKLSQDAAGSSQDEAMDGARIEPGQVQRLEPGEFPVWKPESRSRIFYTVM